MSETTSGVARHYTRGDLATRLLDALRAAGKDPDALTPDDLAPIDEFHIRGREATAEVAALAGITARDRVLDVGCGIGGPSRFLAASLGCQVTGLDLTEEFCQVAAMLAERTGLGARADYRQGNALDMPFEESGFDVVWTQHAAMNIPDKARLYAEMFRVLKPGGRLAIYDVLAGPGGPAHYPVPWAPEPSISFLISQDALRGHLEGAGFVITHWRDASAEAIGWFHETRAKAEAAAQAGRQPLNSLGVLFGPETAKTLAQNMLRSLTEGRIAVIQVAGRKPA